MLSRGKSSSNSQIPTKQYEQLVAMHGEYPNPEMTDDFIGKYLKDNKINIGECVEKFQKDWDSISGEYQKRAETIFGVSLPGDIVAYLTINSRCPYSIENNFFYVSAQSLSARKTSMHELWHFYTWHAFGADWEEKIGKQKYNDLKEAITVLLNIECKDLMPEGIVDGGYPQHKELRDNILEYWAKDRNMINLWKNLVGQQN